MVTGLKLDAHQNHPSILHLHDTSSNTSSCWAVSVNVNLETKVSSWHPRPQWFLKGSYYAFPLFILVGVYVRAYTDLQSDKSQSPLKREIFHYYYFFFFLFKNYNEQLILTTKLFSCICDITKIIPPTEIWMVGGRGERLVEHCMLQNGNPARVFISLYFWWKPIVFRKCWMSFSFHLACNVC